ncbi:hypothetical protein [Streptomyces sp. NPDC005423]|uniref:hypothetical protein n=1 Tax=Streptomyces sp. NPDC005423 TaxID=3155343 RepID=UPI0033A78805
MHRTSTTAALLVTVAVSALTGCVAVQGPPASETSSRPSLPRPDGSTASQAGQAPAREALTGPSRHPRPAAPPVPQRPPAPGLAPPRPTAPRARPEPPRPRRPHAQLPGLPAAVPTPDMCALGRQFGGWRPDSPQAVICRKTYGS